MKYRRECSSPRSGGFVAGSGAAGEHPRVMRCVSCITRPMNVRCSARDFGDCRPEPRVFVPNVVRRLHAGPALPERASVRLIPEARTVAQDEKHERGEPEPQPEEDGEGRQRRLHLRVPELGQAVAPQAHTPARRSELTAPVALAGVPGFDATPAVRPVELEAHRRAEARADASSDAGPARGGPLSGWSSSPSKSRCSPPSQKVISWVNVTSLLNSAPTDSPRWIRLMASPMSGATDSVLIWRICLAAGSGMESVRTTSRRFDFWIRSTAGPDRMPWVAHA